MVKCGASYRAVASRVNELRDVVSDFSFAENLNINQSFLRQGRLSSGI